MLHEIFEYISKNSSVDLTTIALHFDLDKTAAEGMLYLLIRKNLIKELSFHCGNCKGNCGNCPFSGTNKTYMVVKKSQK